MVLERHHSRRICLMLLALDTPKLWDRFSLGLESTGLGRLHINRTREMVLERVSMFRKWYLSTIIPTTSECCIALLLPVTGLWVQSFKDRSPSLSSNVSWQSLWPHQLPPPLSHLPEASVTAYITSSAGQEHRGVRQFKKLLCPILKDPSIYLPVMLVGHSLSRGWICFLCKRQTVTVNHMHDVVMSNSKACVFESMAHHAGGEIQELW